MDRKSDRPIEVPFVKMQGLGNDYLYIDRFAYRAEHDWSALSRAMSERHFGAGSDGVILIEPSGGGPTSAGIKADFRMRIFNSDGSEGDMCGNGMRCFARYVYEHGLTRKTQMVVETRHGFIRPRLNLSEDGRVETVSVDMGMPLFARRDIPLSRLDGPEPVIGEPVEVDGHVFRGTALSTGNPHFVIFVDSLQEVDLERIGPKLERHPLFPSKANIEFVAVKSSDRMDMRVWERGSGITLACGTGASAAVVAAVINGFSVRDTPVAVSLPGGSLIVEWKTDNHIWQTGPAEEVYAGVFFCGAR